jgi:hypothetical protein
VIIDFLISKDGLRVDNVDVSMSGIRVAKGSNGLSPQTADSVRGSVRLTLADLTAALTRPEILDQLLAGAAGFARPDIAFTDSDGGGVRLTGSIEIMGRRFPITAFSRLTIENNKVVVSATQLEGVPMLGALSSRLPSLALPLTLPAGLRFTTVDTAPGAIVVGFEGTDVPLTGAPTIARPEPGTGASGATDAPNGPPRA